MSVPLRLLANIEEWTYSVPWTLVSQGFTQPAGTCNWPLPRHRPCLYDQKQEPKECVYLDLWMLETQYLCSNARLSPCTLDISVARMGGRTLYTMNTALLNLQADKPAPCPVSCMQTASQQSTVQPTSTSLQYPVSSQSRLAWQIVGPHVIHKWALAQHAQVTRPVSVEVTCFTYVLSYATHPCILKQLGYIAIVIFTCTFESLVFVLLVTFNWWMHTAKRYNKLCVKFSYVKLRSCTPTSYV